jgi:hypothetical protein
VPRVSVCVCVYVCVPCAVCMYVGGWVGIGERERERETDRERGCAMRPLFCSCYFWILGDDKRKNYTTLIISPSFQFCTFWFFLSPFLLFSFVFFSFFFLFDFCVLGVLCLCFFLCRTVMKHFGIFSGEWTFLFCFFRLLMFCFCFYFLFLTSFDVFLSFPLSFFSFFLGGGGGESSAKKFFFFFFWGGGESRAQWAYPHKLCMCVIVPFSFNQVPFSVADAFPCLSRTLTRALTRNHYWSGILR